MSYGKGFIVFVGLFFLIACHDKKPTPKSKGPVNDFVVCTEPRPDICSQDYGPICGQVSTGVVCVTTPCPSTKTIPFANGCVACSSKDTIGYWNRTCSKVK